MSARPPHAGLALPGWLASAAHVLISGALPLLLVLVNARLLMSNAYLRWEYNRPGFPPDSYGFSTADRLTHAPRALAYLFNREGIEYLGDQTFPDGAPLFNERELSHMDDVKQVTRGLQGFGFGLMAVWGLLVIGLAASPAARPGLLRALLAGGLLTIGLILLGLVAVATSFDWLFTQFHTLFFEGDSWLFLYSDTLIRLFPERFWIDAFVLMFGGALVEAAIIGTGAWLVGRRKKTA